jgi:hypothetical protein
MRSRIKKFITGVKHIFKCKWIIDERPSKEGDFKYGWSPVFFYEKCEICDKKRNDSPFKKELTMQIEKIEIDGENLRKDLRGIK